MAVTPEIEAEILAIYHQNPVRFSPFRAAKKVGATVSEVLLVVNRTTPENFAGVVARVDLDPFIVASRRATDRGWDNDSIGIVTARARFEAGTHDMATHREGAWLHLCSIPLRRFRKPRPGFFIGKANA